MKQSTPYTVTVVYYDYSIAINSLLEFAICLAGQKLGLSTDLILTKQIDFATLEKSSCSILVQPNKDGTEILEDIIDIIRQKITVNQYRRVYPIFVLLPSSLYNKSNMTFISEDQIPLYSPEEYC